MANSSFPLRFKDEDQRARVAHEAAALGQSVNSYILNRVDPSADARVQLVRNTARTVYAWTAESPEFDELDARLAAGPHSSPPELGFDPAAAAEREAA